MYILEAFPTVIFEEIFDNCIPIVHTIIKRCFQYKCIKKMIPYGKKTIEGY